MDPVIAKIREELAALADPQVEQSARRFFREDIRCYGIKTAAVTALAKRHWMAVKTRPKEEIFALCEELYRPGVLEETFIVSSWAYALSSRYEREDLRIFERWIGSYITNWASCDGFCNHTLGSFMEQFPECISVLEQWTRSENRWMRRAAAVSLIIPAKHGKFPDESLRIAGLLLEDKDDMVRKGYGWLLKEVSRQHTGEVFAFIMENKTAMPRTSLRYAIELMSRDLKDAAMKKDATSR